MLIKRSFSLDQQTQMLINMMGSGAPNRGEGQAGEVVILHPGLPGTFQFMSAFLEGLLATFPLILKETWLK